MDVCIVQDLDPFLEKPGNDDGEAHPQEVVQFQEKIQGHKRKQDAPNNVAHKHHFSGEDHR